jgi:hypothetical protein
MWAGEKSLMTYLKHKTNQLVLEVTHRDYDSKLLLTIASNQHIENGKDFSELRKMFYKNDFDTRTGDEIIADTFRKHGLKIGGSK